jgi:hypothetical protein
MRARFETGTVTPSLPVLHPDQRTIPSSPEKETTRSWPGNRNFGQTALKPVGTRPLIGTTRMGKSTGGEVGVVRCLMRYDEWNDEATRTTDSSTMNPQKRNSNVMVRRILIPESRCSSRQGNIYDTMSTAESGSFIIFQFFAQALCDFKGSHFKSYQNEAPVIYCFPVGRQNNGNQRE